MIDLEIESTETNIRGHKIQIELFEDETFKNSIYQSVLELTSKPNPHFETTFKHVRKWTAETPNLYYLQISLLNSENNIIESVTQQVGFKRVEINNGQLLMNGKAIMFRGVNRHEWDPVTGRAITYESMIEDMSLSLIHI